jgi:hypothetical protein
MSAPRFMITFALCCTAAPALSKPAPDPYVPVGKPVDCINRNMIQSTNVRDDHTIDFIVSGNKVYRNILPNNCPSLASERRFLYKTSISQLCSVDIITVLYSAADLSRGASCGLGKFQPMSKITK